MSVDVKNAMMERMQADLTLVGLLAKDPNDTLTTTGHPQAAIFNGHMSAMPAVYPCVTFRNTTSVPTRDFEPTPIEYNQSPQPRVVEERYDFEIWDQINDAGVLRDSVRARLDVLFRAVSFTTSGGATVFSSLCVSQSPDDFLPTLHANFSALSYVMRVQYTS